LTFTLIVYVINCVRELGASEFWPYLLLLLTCIHHIGEKNKLKLCLSCQCRLFGEKNVDFHTWMSE